MSDDTWGIPGPTFLGAFAVAAVAAFVTVLVIRRVLAKGSPYAGWQPEPEQLAYFNGGPFQAIVASLAGLRASGSVGTGPGGGLAAVGHPPIGPTPLTWAVYQGAQRGRRTRHLSAEAAVQAALADIKRILIRRGWLLSAGTRTRIRLAALLPLGLAAVGAARYAAGNATGKPVGGILVLTIVMGIVGLRMLAVPSHARAAKRQLRALRARYSTLNPAVNRGMVTHGLGPATALAVGLFGVHVLVATDPAFAAQTGILASTGSGGGGGGGGSDSDGDSGDGGGDGGGGGCGGGCGG